MVELGGTKSKPRQREVSAKQHTADAGRGGAIMDGVDRIQRWRSIRGKHRRISGPTSLLTWLLLDILFFEKPSVIGATQGMITGLVCITPAAGSFNLIDQCCGFIPSQTKYF
ncbi:hypothetical protein HYC85_024929 [Camellia sinensis]|uniref:Uncharacterized protein n=1 Tax=Camellia sinensis TaxID=4442 RepID=A0A7J7G9I1_CAMSI|nr:hypothetical protein HYC85_024929 [Camellia sinensis]